MEATSRDRLERSLELYRDLSMALRERITQLKTGLSGDQSDKQAADAARAHQMVLQSVLDIEASLGKFTRAWGDGGHPLDLDSARAEIAARLACWSDRG